MKRKYLKQILRVATLSFLCMAPGVRADIFNPAWESPIEDPSTGSAISGLQAFRGHVSSTSGATVTVRLLIEAFAVSLQLPWGTDRSDVATSGPDRFSGFGDVLNVGGLPPGGPVSMTLEMREGGGSGPCNAPTCVSITRNFTVVKPGARAGEIAPFRFANGIAQGANLVSPATNPLTLSNVAVDAFTPGGDILVAPITVVDSASGGGGVRNAAVRLRWQQNLQAYAIVDTAPSDSSFSAVQEILGAKCGVAGCHDGGSGTTLPLPMDLRTSQASYFSSVAVRSLESVQVLRVTPRSLTSSYLYQKIIPNGVIAAGTVRMPAGCPGTIPCLSDAEINTIGNWILNGAPPPVP
jgi:hypothetical protein